MKVLYKILFILLFTLSLSAKDLQPSKTFKTFAGVVDIIKNNNDIYVSTKKGTIEKLNINKKIKILLSMPKILNFRGNLNYSKIYSLDILNNNILILSQGMKGTRELHIYSDKLKTLIPSSSNLYISRAKFINDNLVIFSTLGNELYLYNIKEKKFEYMKKISSSKFSNFKLNENKSEIIIVDESGDLKVHNVINGELIKLYENYNLDNVFQVDTKKGIILTAGQDRKSFVFNQGKTYSKKVQFLIYSCALSPSGKIAAIANDEENNILVFDTKNKKELFSLKGNKMTITNILFLNEEEVVVTSDNSIITYYKLKN